MSGEPQVTQHGTYPKTGQYQGQFMAQSIGQFQAADSNQFMAEGIEQGMGGNQYEVMTNYGQTGIEGDQFDERSGASSKLQASLKPYERRNKKKRPPGYYKQSESGGTEQEANEYTPVQPDLTQPPPNFHQEMQFGIPPPGLAPNHYGVNSQFVGGNLQNPAHIANFHAGGQIPYQGASGPSGVGNVIINTVPNSQRQETGDLCEVVIDSVAPQNNANIPARPETYQIQDHERTNSQNSAFTDQSSANVHEFHPIANIPIESQTSDSNSVNTCVSKPTRVDVSIKDAPVLEETSQIHLNDTQLSAPKQETGSNSESTVQNNEHSVATTKDTAEPVSMDTSNVDPVLETKEQSGSANQDAVTLQQEAVSSQNDPVSAVTVKPEPVKSKPTSWAGLFKSKSTSNSGVSEAPVKSSVGDNSSVSAESDQRSEKELSPLPVPACEDSAAKDLGGMLYSPLFEKPPPW